MCLRGGGILARKRASFGGRGGRPSPECLRGQEGVWVGGGFQPGKGERYLHNQANYHKDAPAYSLVPPENHCCNTFLRTQRIEQRVHTRFDLTGSFGLLSDFRCLGGSSGGTFVLAVFSFSSSVDSMQTAPRKNSLRREAKYDIYT